MKTATRPDFFASFPIKKEEVDKSGASDEEKFLYGMSQTSGFPIFTQKKDELLAALESVNETAIASGADLAQVGENAIIVNHVRGLIKRLWSFVDDAKEACERPTGGQ